MAIINNISATKSDVISATTKPGQRLISVRVIDIILHNDHDKFEAYGNYDSIGTIFYTKIEDNTPLESEKHAHSAKPLFSFIKNYPLINEVVLIVDANDKQIYNSPHSISSYYLPNINIWNHPHHNALPTLKGLKDATSIRDYESTEDGLTRNTEEGSDGSTDIYLGEYFNEKLNIKPLFPYEGDTIVEGRFGNSIRFGATTPYQPEMHRNYPKTGNPSLYINPWSNTGSVGDPITIIKNGQSKKDNKGWIPSVENINEDNSSMYMTSTQQLSNFIVSSTNQKSFGANFFPPVPLEQQLTELPPNNYVTEPIIQPISNEEFITSNEQPYVPHVSVPPESATPISDDPFGDYEAEVLEANGPVGWYEIESETDINIIIPSSQTNITHTDEYTVEEGSTPVGDFNYDLFCHSDTAVAKNISNTPGIDDDILKVDILSNLQKLEENIIRNIKSQYPSVVLTSVYRCRVLNSHLNGATKSDHLHGRAVDFQVPGVTTQTLFNWCVLNLPSYSQLIWEHPERGFPPEGSWIHISYNEEKGNGKEGFVKTDNSTKYQIIDGIATIQPE